MKYLTTYIIIFILLTAMAMSAGNNSFQREIEELAALPDSCLFNNGEEAFLNGDFDKALKIYTILLPRIENCHTADEQHRYAAILDRVGNIYYKKSSYSTSMEYYLRARKVAEQNEFYDILSKVYTNIGNIYASGRDYDAAIDFYKRALMHPDKEIDASVRARSAYNLFAANYFKNNTDSALCYLDMYERFATENPRRDFDMKLGRAMIIQSAGLSDSAIKLYKQAAKYSIGNNLSPACTASAYNSVASCFENINMLDSALHYIRITESIAGTNDNYRQLVNLKSDKSRLFAGMGMQDSALHYKAEYLNIVDSLSYLEEFGKLKSSQMLYELDRSASEIKDLSSERSMQRKWIFAMLCAMVVFTALIIALYIQKKNLKRAWDDLYLRNSHQIKTDLAHRRQIKALQTELDSLRTPQSEDHSEDNHASEEDAGRKLIIPAPVREKIKQQISSVMDDENNFCAPDFNIDKLASLVGSKARYVSEVINEEFGKSFREMLNDYRIRTAMIRLCDNEHYGRLTIKAIAESVGYRSQATFITVFTKQTGLKPSLYQKLASERHHSPDM